MIPGRPAGRPRSVLLLVIALLLAGGAAALAVGVLGSGARQGADEVPGSAEPDPSSPDRPESEGEGTEPPEGTAGSSTGPETPRPSGGREGASEEKVAGEPASGDTREPASGAAARPSPGGATDSLTGEAGETEAGPAAPEVARILARAERTYADLSSLRARFRQTIEVPLMDRRRDGHGIWYQAGRGRFRMDFLEPPEDEIVADGIHLWLYYPSTNPKQVIKSPLGSGETRAGTADVLARILEEARTAYEGTYAGRERVAGVETHRIALAPLDPGSPYRRVRVWIGVEDDLVRRFEITEANETVRTVTLTQLEPNVPIPEGTFRFTPPADADVFAR